MEKVVRNHCFYLVTVFSCTFGFSQSPDKIIVSKIENRFGDTELTQYHVLEEPKFDNFTLSLEKVKFDRKFFHVYFFSELNDTFIFFIDGLKVKTENINTEDYNGRGEDPVVRLLFPENKNTFTLKVTSSDHGSFETQVDRRYPMIYNQSRPGE